MFTSHKTDAPPLLRQLSTDSSVTGPPSTASTSDPWTSQYLDERSYGAMQSPERSHRPYPSKRSSVFNLRSRSNTGASTTSVQSMSPPSMSYHDASRPGTPLILQYGSSENELPGTRRSLFRGKKGKRLSDSVSSNMIVAEYQGKDASDKRTSVLRKVRRRNNPSEQIRECYAWT